MLPYLRDHGWEPTMVCVEDPSETRNRDERLAFNIPAGTEILRIRCPRAWPGFGSLGLRSYGSLRKAGEHWIGENRPDLVYLTTTEFDLFRLGPAWRRKTGVPYVLDYQDPWVTDYYERPGAPRPLTTSGRGRHHPRGGNGNMDAANGGGGALSPAALGKRPE